MKHTPLTTDILLLLQQSEGYLSGEHLSSRFGISRTAIWKHISALRAAQYHIEAVPSQGYRLISSPDVLDTAAIAKQLTEIRYLGSSLICHDTTVSTNLDAFRLAEQGAPEGTVVLADSQSGGKGRRGRTWVSPPGVNIHCSIILRPDIMPYEAPQLTFLSAIAVARAIEKTTDSVPEIKWPNDVLLKGRKVAGLLNEMSAETDGVTFIILGIGINVNMTADQFPDDLRYPATSLYLASGIRTPRNQFAGTLVQELDRCYTDFLQTGFEPVRQEWQQRCAFMGHPVRVSDGGKEIAQGLLSGIDNDGALLVTTSTGTRERVLCGDVSLA